MTATATRIASLNSATNDYTTPTGVRISTPCYVDLTTSQRKELLNAARDLAHSTSESTPRTQSGISVVSTNGGLNQLEMYLNAGFDIVRTQLFQRGGVNLDLIIKLQNATGLEVVSVKELEAALKSKAAIIKEYVAQNPYNK